MKNLFDKETKPEQEIQQIKHMLNNLIPDEDCMWKDIRKGVKEGEQKTD